MMDLTLTQCWCSERIRAATVRMRQRGAEVEAWALLVDSDAVALNIKNEEAQKLSRELAALTGESITTAVTVAVGERLERLRNGQVVAADRASAILELGRQIAVALPDSLAVEHLYDERGMPA